MFAIVEDDMVILTTTVEAPGTTAIPSELLSLRSTGRLRLLDGAFIDAATHAGPFYVDPTDLRLTKHVAAGAGRQEVECAFDAELILVGGSVAVVTPAMQQAAAKAALLAYAADKRWQLETGGITVGGVSVATDDRSKIMILGARVKAEVDGGFTTEWKTATGFQTIDAATIIAISDAVQAHVAACFAAEGVVLGEIEAGTITSKAEIDAATWPGQ